MSTTLGQKRKIQRQKVKEGSRKATAACLSIGPACPSLCLRVENGERRLQIRKISQQPEIEKGKDLENGESFE
ncbi:hypothetical protein NL676_025448 [Syzygium grande]|nr:hypothetical protein NL676_025448 [Syzygium grande]